MQIRRRLSCSHLPHAEDGLPLRRFVNIDQYLTTSLPFNTDLSCLLSLSSSARTSSVPMYITEEGKVIDDSTKMFVFLLFPLLSL